MPFEAPSGTDQNVPPLRIALVTPSWPGRRSANGIATAVAHLSVGLEAIGHEVTILAHWIDGPHDHPRVIVLPDQRMSALDRLMFRVSPARVLKRSIARSLLLAARQAIEQYRVEVIVAEETQGWAGDIRAKLPVPVIATLHGPWWLHRTRADRPDGRAGRRREAQEARGLQKVDGIIAPSRDVRDRTDEEWGLPNVPTAVIGNPIDVKTDTALAADGADPKILFVGRFDRIKGGDLVIKAFSRIAAAHPTCELTFVGPDPGIRQDDGSTQTLAQLYASLPQALQGRITVLGKRTQEEILALRRSHPIALIASRYETFGVALIEAMSVGAAVVCTRVGGCGEIVRDGETGLFVPPDDADALAGACLKLLADQPLRRRLGEAARDDVRARFAPEVIARQVAAFVEPICRASTSDSDLSQAVIDPAIDHRR
jgi:glycosyltransferase involved in cell wall biosynthesis